MKTKLIFYRFYEDFTNLMKTNQDIIIFFMSLSKKANVLTPSSNTYLLSSKQDNEILQTS